ncbi:MAG: copper resistance protein B [Burkholderiales bacterium]
MKLILRSAIVVFALALASAVRAQDTSETMDHSQQMETSGDMEGSGEMDHSQHMDHSEPATDSGAVDHSQHMDSSENMDHSEHIEGTDDMDHSGHAMESSEPDNSVPMDHSNHATQAGQPAAAAAMEMSVDTEELRDPHAYAEGEDFGPLGRPQLLDEAHFGAVLIDRLESVQSSDNSWFAFSGQAWYGSTYNRANLKLELEADSGEVEHSRTELLWSHAVASFWDTQLGVRFDSGETPDRTWAAFGVQGLAPYWFHVDAALYAGEHGDTAARFEAEYELLFTQRLILQPRLETNLYGQNDAETGTGSGLSDLTVGLRLRYEITRQFAPYVGIQWAGLYGNAADYARDDNSPTEETSWVIGLHMWF